MKLLIHLTPNASHNKIEGWEIDEKGEKRLRIKVTAVPEDGKANDALIKLLSKTFSVPKSKITIVRGAKARLKEVEIEGGQESLLILCGKN